MFTLILDDTLKETTIHGNRDFPFEVYFGGVSLFAEGYLDWHWHDYFEINYVTSGKLHYLIENKEYVLKEGEAVFINAGRLHRGYTEEQDQMSHTVVFGGDLFCSDTSSEWYHTYVKNFVDSDINGVVLSPYIPWMKQILDKLKKLYEEYQKGSAMSRLFAKGYLCEIYAEIWKQTAHDSRPTAMDTEKMKRMRILLSYIAQNYMNPITLKDLASRIGLSETECSRFFNKQMKQTPFAYLVRYRIERSCELLVNSDKTISEIALQSGFNSFSYYSKCFRRIMHCTPLEYRQNIRDAIEK